MGFSSLCVWVHRDRNHSILGDFFALLSAVTDGLFAGQTSFILFTYIWKRRYIKEKNIYLCSWKIVVLIIVIIHWQNTNSAVLLKKYAGEEGEKVDIQKFFGYIGLFTLVSLWWLGKTNFLCSDLTFSINLSTCNLSKLSQQKCLLQTSIKDLKFFMTVNVTCCLWYIIKIVLPCTKNCVQLST